MTVAQQSIAKTMRAREVEITAPYGGKGKTIAALRAAGVAVRANGTAHWDPDRDADNAYRPDQAAVADLGRAGLIRILPSDSRRDYAGRIVFPKKSSDRRLYPLCGGKAARILSSERLSEACRRNRSAAVGRYPGGVGYRIAYRVTGSEAVEEILRRVGPAGEQALADEARYFETYDREQYDSRNHAGRDWRGVSRAVIASDESAAILSFVEAGSYLHKGRQAEYDLDTGRLIRPGGLHHLRISAYLVVRDASSGERHVLRVPPRFGSTRSATWKRYLDESGTGDADGLIHEAVAWTFGLRPQEYSPGVQA